VSSPRACFGLPTVALALLLVSRPVLHPRRTAAAGVNGLAACSLAGAASDTGHVTEERVA